MERSIFSWSIVWLFLGVNCLSGVHGPSSINVLKPEFESTPEALIMASIPVPSMRKPELIPTGDANVVPLLV